jgi:hypothetical protein
MTAARLFLMILCALALQQLLPAIGVTDWVSASTSTAWQEGPAHDAPRGTSLRSR